MNKPLLFLLGAALTAPLSADTRLTIPAAASIVGAAPFFSDVRVFNTSYSASIEVTATYRCFLGACPAGAVQEIFVLSPRESRAFNDMVVSAFDAPNSAGGVELEVGSGATASDIVVTSRLYSTSPVPTVGMFVPGLPDSAAHRYAVLPQIANASGSAGFRTNVGAFNGEDVAASVTFAVYSGTFSVFLGQVQRQVPAHSGVQINNIFGPDGINQPELETSNVVVTVQTDGPVVFSYAAVIDNTTTDPIFVRGAADPAPVLSVGGNYSTTGALVPGQSTCSVGPGQDTFTTTIVQTPGSHEMSLIFAGGTYHGTVEDDGQFSITYRGRAPALTTTIAGQFSRAGFTATVRVDRTEPAPACFYLVDWVSTKLGGANIFP